MKRNTKVIAAIALAVLCGTQSAVATVLKKETIDSLSRNADFVVVGQIVDVRMVIDRSQPWTVATVIVENQVKGNGSRTIHFRIPGGMYVVNGRTLVTVVEGTPVLNRLEKAVFFLSSRGPEYPQLVGWNQGLWRVKIQNGVEVAVRSDEDSRAGAVPLQHFLKEIEKSVRRRP